MEELPDLADLCAFDEQLREVARDPAAVEDALDAARAALGVTTDPVRQLYLHSYAGNALRLLGRHADAVAAQERAVALALTSGEERRLILDAGRLEEAAAALGEALALREVMGDEQLTSSTRLALDRARRG